MGRIIPYIMDKIKKTVWNHQPVVDSIWKSHVAVNPPWFLITEQCWHQRWAFTGDVDAQKLKAIFQFAEPKGKPQLVGGWYRYTSWKLWKSMGRIIRFNPYYIYILGKYVRRVFLNLEPRFFSDVFCRPF